MDSDKFTYICPCCNLEHLTRSRYSSTICDRCLNKYKIDKLDGSKINYVYQLKQFVYTSIDRECFVNSIPCYVVDQYPDLFVIATKDIPKIKK
jgi:hypothetical protein